MNNIFLPRWANVFLAELMRIMKLAKYRLKAQVEKDGGLSGEGQSPQVEKDEGPEEETL